MFKKLFLTSFLIISIIGIYYPSRKENTRIFDYCYSLEKILSRNSIQKRKNVSLEFKTLYGDIAKFGVSKTRGSFINNIINQYKSSKNSLIIKVVPNKLYCYAGYWIEKTKPGTLESILYSKSKNAINEFSDFKDELKGLLDNVNSEYKDIKENFNDLF